MKTAFNLQTVEDSPAFRAYCAGFATTLRTRLHALDAQEEAWLRQFGEDLDASCQKLIDAYALDQITARLAQHPT